VSLQPSNSLPASEWHTITFPQQAVRALGTIIPPAGCILMFGGE